MRAGSTEKSRAVEHHRHVAAGRVLAAAGVTVAAAAAELVGSSTAGSRFLVADAVHLLAHLAIFVVLLLPARGAHDRREDAATCTILGLVIVVAIGIGVEAARALIAAAPAPRPAALLLSLFGLGANLLTAFWFRDPAHERWSFRAALAHELADASLTIVALAGAGAIALFGFRWIDPALSAAVAGWLLGWAGRLLVRRIRLGRAAWAR